MLFKLNNIIFKCSEVRGSMSTSNMAALRGNSLGHYTEVRASLKGIFLSCACRSGLDFGCLGVIVRMVFAL